MPMTFRLLLLGLLASVGRADVNPHAEEDSFALEVAALVPPPPPPPVAPPPTPAERSTLGDWGPVIPWTPHIPVSAALLPDGRLLTFASNERTTFPAGREFTYAATWDPNTGEFVEYNHDTHDMFCGGLVSLPDGRVLVNGGRNISVRSSIFDWRQNTWTRIQDMNDPRWYNTSVGLPDGRVWTVSGSGGSRTAERWDELSGWSRLPDINWGLILNEAGYIKYWHPFVLVAPDGRLFHFGPTDTMHWVSPEGSGALADAGVVVPGSHYPKEGSWAMYNEGKILVAGGGDTPIENTDETSTGVSTTRAYTVDLTGATPVVSSVSPMRFARQFANNVVLPNGEVMVIGGNTSGYKFFDNGSIMTPEIWNPVTKLWRSVADSAVPRNYHSLALLLPDGRVFSGGGGLGGTAADHRDGQIFTPPSLFNPDGTLATRPVLTLAPQVIGAGTHFIVKGTPGLTKFSFIRMSAMTHSVNTDLRYLTLPFTETEPGTYELTARANLNVMTPGYWMLFGLNGAGVHSVSKTIQVDSTASVRITLPGDQASYLGQEVSLQLVPSGPAGAHFTWSATGLPNGLSIDPSSGWISGSPTAVGVFSAEIRLTDGVSSDSITLAWAIEPSSIHYDYPNFSGGTGLTLSGSADVVGGALRLTPNEENQIGSAFLTAPILLGGDTSFSTRWVFRIHGTDQGAEGMAFVVQGSGPDALGAGGNGLGYDGLAGSVAVEIDNSQGSDDPNGNHLGILRSGQVQNHLAAFTPGWDLEDGLSHTLWVDYDGRAKELRVFLAQGNVTTKPTAAAMTYSIDLAQEIGNQAWLGFTAATGSVGNNHDVEAWNLSVNAFSLPAAPVIVLPPTQFGVVGVPLNLQLQASDANGDLLTWSSSGLPPGLSLNPSTGLIKGSPGSIGTFPSVITVADGNMPAVSVSVSWVIDAVLTLQPLSGTPVQAGGTVNLSVTAAGGKNPRFRWSFGDGTPDSAFSSSPGLTHSFASPGRFLVTVTGRDDTGREITASYYQGVHAALTARRPLNTSALAYSILSGGSGQVWVVNPDQDTVAVLDVDSGTKLAEIPVGVEPKTLSLAPDGRIWVANAVSANLTVIRPDYSIAQTIPLPRGSRPFGVLADPAGSAVYVALEAVGRILKLNPATGAVMATLEVGPDVRHLALSADGSQLLASRFITPRLPGEDTAVVETTVNGVKQGGEILVVQLPGFNLTGKTILAHSEAPDTSNSAKGIPNYLGAPAISPDGLSAWVPSKQDNIKRGRLRSGADLTHDMSLRSIASRIVLGTGVEDIAGRVDFDNGGIASAVALDPQGLFVFAALEGSREVAVIDAWAKREILRFVTGRAPQAVAVSPDGLILAVQNFMDRSVSLFDLTPLQEGSVVAPHLIATLGSVAQEKLSPTVLLGKQHFYDARDPRLAFQQYLSCASCHNDAGHDGRVWDFTQFGEGLRNTITLRGHGGAAQGPLHWTGNFDEVQDFEGQIRAFARGSGLMTDTDFHAGTRSQPLGDPKAGRSADLDALAAYLSSLDAHGASPDRNPDGSFTASALAGQAVFQQQNCIQCHSGSQFTDSAVGVFHDVGTIRSTSGQRLGGKLTGFDTPTLRGLWATAPYLHNGSAATLGEAVTAHSGVTLSPAELADLVAFLRQLDDGLSPPPTTLVARGAEWRYLDNNEAPPSTWTSLSFNDSLWNSGPAPLGYGDGDEATVIGFGPDTNAKYPTTWFRRSFTLANVSRYLALNLSVLRDDGAVVYLNGNEVFRSNMPEGTITPSTPALTVVSGADESTKFYSQSLAPGLLREGLNVLAVEIHQSSGTSSDISFDLELAGTVAPVLPTVRLTSPGGNSTYAAPANIPLAASAAELENGISRVEFFNGGERVGQDDTAPYAFSWEGVTAGQYALRAVAYSTLGIASTSAPVTVTVTNAVTSPFDLVSAGSLWNYNDEGVDLGTAWRELTYDDSDWPQGMAQLGYSPDEKDEATLLQYGSDANNKNITYYFRREFRLEDLSAISELQVRYLRDDGIVVYLNGKPIVRDNFANGDITFATHALTVVSGAAESRWFTNSVDPKLLVSGRNVLAVEVHQQSPTSSDISFDLALFGRGMGLAPVIHREPQGLLVSPGSSYRLDVAAGGTLPLQFQWRKGGTPLDGATSPSLILPDVGPDDAGAYTVVVTNPSGSVTSRVAQINLAGAPIITRQPTPQTASFLGNVAFSVEASGPPTLGYQWFFNGEAVPLANSPTYQIQDIQLNQAGSYWVVVSNAYGELMSAKVLLTVIVPDTDRDGMPDWWEDLHRLNKLNPADASEDLDGDGQTNLAEFQAGTDPRDAGSVLWLGVIREGNRVSLYFNTAANKRYTLEFTDRVASGIWTKWLDIPAEAAPRLVKLNSSDEAGARFYRVVTAAEP